MYRRPKFLEILLEIREDMSRRADYDMDLFLESIRTGKKPSRGIERHIRGFRSYVPLPDEKPERS